MTKIVGVVAMMIVKQWTLLVITQNNCFTYLLSNEQRRAVDVKHCEKWLLLIYIP